MSLKDALQGRVLQGTCTKQPVSSCVGPQVQLSGGVFTPILGVKLFEATRQQQKQEGNTDFIIRRAASNSLLSQIYQTK